MEIVVLFYPPTLVVGQPAPGAWPPDESQQTIRFEMLAALRHFAAPGPDGQPIPMIQLDGLGDWSLRRDSWAASREPDAGERNAYQQWRAAQAGLELAGANDPLFKDGKPPRSATGRPH